MSDRQLPLFASAKVVRSKWPTAARAQQRQQEPELMEIGDASDDAQSLGGRQRAKGWIQLIGKFHLPLCQKMCAATSLAAFWGEY
jgi:hypothetical protein